MRDVFPMCVVTSDTGWPFSFTPRIRLGIRASRLAQPYGVNGKPPVSETVNSLG